MKKVNEYALLTPESLRPGLPSTPEAFEAKYGRVAQDDDLVRLHCTNAGERGHWCCGECPTHQQPQLVCACRVKEMAHERA